MRMGMPANGITFFVIVVVLWITGCTDDGPQLAPVEGTVLLDGKPINELAQVIFQPEEGSPSYGKTDANGHYTLLFTRDKEGAMVGKHVVQITTKRREEDGNDRMVNIPELLPAQYNERSELVREVKPGVNVFDFDLKSK